MQPKKLSQMTGSEIFNANKIGTQTEVEVGCFVCCEFQLRNRVGLLRSYSAHFFSPRGIEHAYEEAIEYAKGEAILTKKTLLSVHLVSANPALW